jgi:hypothetical protein
LPDKVHIDEPSAQDKVRTGEFFVRGWITSDAGSRFEGVELFAHDVRMPLEFVDRPDVQSAFPHLASTGFQGWTESSKLAGSPHGLAVTVNGERRAFPLQLAIDRGAFEGPSGTAAYGDKAASAVARFPKDGPIVAADASGAAEALHEALRRRRLGQPFFAFPVIESTRVEAARRSACKILERVPKYDGRRELFLALAQGRLPDDYADRSVSAIDPAAISVLRDLLRAADGVVVRSWAEAAEIDASIGEPHPFVERAVADYPVPRAPMANAKGANILIWGPEYEAKDLSLLIFALEDLHAGVFVVSADNGASVAGYSLRAGFLDASAVGALEGVAAVVVASTDDPSPAIALAAWNVPLAVASTSGAREYLTGAHAFTPWDIDSVLTAAQTAVAGIPTRKRAEIPDAAGLQIAARATCVPKLQDEPLVSIVVMTKNRRGVLPRALESVRRQTYENIDLVVVNDGGEDVADLLADFPRARYVTNPESLGPLHVLDHIFEHVSGDYFAELADDDIFYPDYVARAVYALERTGGAIARAMTATSILREAHGALQILGHYIHTPPAIDRSTMLVQNVNGGSSLFRMDVARQHRNVTIDAGLLEDLGLYNRLMQYYDFICVRAVTQCVDVRLDASNYRFVSPEKLAEHCRRVYEAFPVPDRPSVQRTRDVLLEHVLNRLEGPHPAVPLRSPRPADYAPFS